MLHLICPLGTIATTVATGLAEPVGLTPIFYLLPMLVAGYFLPRAEILANFGFALLCLGIGLATWVDPGLRLAMFMAVGLITGVVTLVVLALREQIRVLVTRLGELAIHDSLTGALNRGAFEQRLEAELARTDRMGGAVRARRPRRRPLQADQRHGRPRRRRRRAARARADDHRRQAPLGRLRPYRRRGVRGRASRHRARGRDDVRREAAHVAAGDDGRRHVSFGVTDAATAGRTVRGMLHSADIALYDAKRQGRDRVVTAEGQRLLVASAQR